MPGGSTLFWSASTATRATCRPCRGAATTSCGSRRCWAHARRRPGRPVRSTTLLDAEATRAGVIDSFRRVFADASPGDTALFFYSGHGSQEEAPPEHLAFEPDGLNETLVLFDSRTENGLDLADKELAVLVAEVARRDVHVAVVLDCCHAGSGVRDVPGLRVRRPPTSRRARPAGSYLPGTADPDAGGADGHLHLGRGRYVLLGA